MSRSPEGVLDFAGVELVRVSSRELNSVYTKGGLMSQKPQIDRILDIIDRRVVDTKIAHCALVNRLTLSLLMALGLSVGCDDSPVQTTLLPLDSGLQREMGSYIPEAFDEGVETDMRRRAPFGEPCEEGRECESGYCIDTPNGRVCTDRCIGECPPGFECVPTASGGDETLLCAADGDDLCERCALDSDCDDPQDLCLKIGQFTYCGESCESDNDCPDDFSCQLITREAEGELSEITETDEIKQCVPTSGECAPCIDEDQDGYGVGEDCLGYDCADDDPTRHIDAPELCDLVDNDCDSLIDESPTDTPPAELSCSADGVCAGSTIQCLSGVWGCDYPLDIFEERELSCDGLDNDCDASIDEALESPLSDLQSGVCEAALKLCLGEEGWINPSYAEYSEAFEELEVSCDTLDNDCDGSIDEGYNFAQDIANCGGCGVVCTLPQAQMMCAEGSCLFSACLPNFYDLNQDLSDGCEYGCAVSSGGVEVCDLIDNDCDGEADEGFELASDPQNCGACGRACQFNNATPLCERAQCVLGQCEVGFYDLNERADDGCEYACDFLSDLDTPDANRIDANCDGVDGDLDQAVFLSTQGDDTEDGASPSAAVRTLSRAIEAARALGRSQIWISTGTYSMNRSVTLSDAISLYGGYNATFSQRDGGRSQLSFSSNVGLEVRDLTASVNLLSLSISVSDRVITSESAQAVRVINVGDHLTIEDCAISAGQGGSGRSGSSGSNGSAGLRGNNASGSSGGSGGSLGGGSGGNGRSRNSGLAGSSGLSNGSPCGGGGGSASGTGGLGCNDGNPRGGGAGGNGCNGSVGRSGTGGGGRGSWSGTVWSESTGQSGGTGGRGGGGGGGGAGGGENCTDPVFGTCIYCGSGRGGGGGGGGGNGGGGGRPGSGGGASFAIVIYRSSVVIKDSIVANGGGGSGGDGGTGGAGGAGGAGGSGVNSPSDSEGDGGDGGDGGRGGSGGCGGGGGGGPSVLFQGVSQAQIQLVGEVQTSLSAGGDGGSSCGAPGARGFSALSDQVTVN